MVGVYVLFQSSSLSGLFFFFVLLFPVPFSARLKTALHPFFEKWTAVLRLDGHCELERQTASDMNERMNEWVTGCHNGGMRFARVVTAWFGDKFASVPRKIYIRVSSQISSQGHTTARPPDSAALPLGETSGHERRVHAGCLIGCVGEI